MCAIDQLALELDEAQADYGASCQACADADLNAIDHTAKLELAVHFKFVITTQDWNRVQLLLDAKQNVRSSRRQAFRKFRLAQLRYQRAVTEQEQTTI